MCVYAGVVACVESALDDSELKPIKRVVSLVAHNAGTMNPPAMLNSVANLAETCQVLGVRYEDICNWDLNSIRNNYGRNLSHRHIAS